MITVTVTIGKRPGQPTFLFLDLQDTFMRDAFRGMIDVLIERSVVPTGTVTFISLDGVQRTAQALVVIPPSDDVDRAISAIGGECAVRLGVQLESVVMSDNTYSGCARMVAARSD